MANGTEIKINKEFSIESYDYGWIVNHFKKGVSKKTKETMTVSSQHYFPKLHQVCNYIIDTTTKKTHSLPEILSAIEETKKDILKAISKNKLE